MDSMDDLGCEKGKGLLDDIVEGGLKENLHHVPFVGHVFAPHLPSDRKSKSREY
jgi:hypothetical protein